jgi:hypothetical protein
MVRTGMRCVHVAQASLDKARTEATRMRERARVLDATLQVTHGIRSPHVVRCIGGRRSAVSISAAVLATTS